MWSGDGTLVLCDVIAAITATVWMRVGRHPALSRGPHPAFARQSLIGQPTGAKRCLPLPRLREQRTTFASDVVSSSANVLRLMRYDGWRAAALGLRNLSIARSCQMNCTGREFGPV
jgi:hypothetical protein